MKELELRGSFFEMGRQYGNGCRREIRLFSKAVQLMAALSERPGADLFDPQYRHLPREMMRFFKNRKRYRSQAREFIDSIEAHYPEGLDMMSGMAEGAKVNFDDLLFLNTAIEFTRGCTCYAAAGNATASGRAVLGMNADEARGVERTEIVLRIHPDTGYAYTVCAMAGYLPFNFGMNETGLTFMSHLLFLKPGSNASAGAPMMVYFSVLNRCGSVEEAKALLESLPCSGPGSTVYVADAERFLRMETNSAVRDIEVVEEGIRWNVNDPQMAALSPVSAIADMTEANSLFSKNRTKRMHELSARFSGQLDAEAVQSILGDHGDPHDETHMRSMCMHLNTQRANRRVRRWLRFRPRRPAGSSNPTPAATTRNGSPTDELMQEPVDTGLVFSSRSRHVTPRRTANGTKGRTSGTDRGSCRFGDHWVGDRR